MQTYDEGVQRSKILYGDGYLKKHTTVINAICLQNKIATW